MDRRATMGFGEAVEIAAASLWAHKLRTVLTLLGVVIGVTSVITVVSFINGLNTGGRPSSPTLMITWSSGSVRS